MRIGGTYAQGSTPTQTQATTKGTHAHKHHASHSVGSAPSSGAVKVTVSDKARELDEAQGSDESDKVQQLRSAVESGQFNVDPNKIAAAIVGA